MKEIDRMHRLPENRIGAIPRSESREHIPTELRTDRGHQDIRAEDSGSRYETIDSPLSSGGLGAQGKPNF